MSNKTTFTAWVLAAALVGGAVGVAEANVTEAERENCRQHALMAGAVTFDRYQGRSLDGILAATDEFNPDYIRFIYGLQLDTSREPIVNILDVTTAAFSACVGAANKTVELSL